jgi:hypothetical protein
MLKPTEAGASFIFTCLITVWSHVMPDAFHIGIAPCLGGPRQTLLFSSICTLPAFMSW